MVSDDVWDAITGTLSHASPKLGVTDHARLRYWINAGVKIPAGTYLLDPAAHGPLLIPSGATVDLSGVTIRCAPQPSSQFDMILIRDAIDVTIRGGAILGDRDTHLGTTGEHGMGVRVERSADVTVESVTLADHWGDCIYIGGGDYTRTNRGVTIRDCTLRNARRQGISVTNADGIIIDGCTITDINGTPPEYGIDIETNDPAHPCRNVTVTGCTFRGSAGGGFVVGSPAIGVTVTGCHFDGDAATLVAATDATVSGCTFTDATCTASSGSTAVAITGNAFRNGTLAIYAKNAPVSGVTMSGNVLTNSGDLERKGIERTGAAAATGVTITGNQLTGYTSESIYLYTPVDGVIHGNDIDSPAPSRWVALLRGDLDIRGNRITTGAATPFGGDQYPAIHSDNTVT